MNLWLFLVFFLILGCSESKSNLEHSCQILSNNYHLLLKGKYEASPIDSWSKAQEIHEEILEGLLSRWPQKTPNIKNFSRVFYSFLRTRVYLNCSKEPSISITKKEVKKGIFQIKKQADSPDFSNCFKKQWGKTQNFILNSCKKHFK